MRNQALPSDEVAIVEAIALLRKGPTSPDESVLQQRIGEAVEGTHHYDSHPEHEAWMRKESAARDQVPYAIENLRTALESYANCGTDDCAVTMPLQENLDLELDRLTVWAQPTDWWKRHRPGRGKKQSGKGQALPVAVLFAHVSAVDLLQEVGLRPTTGTAKHGGGSITHLGSLICRAAGVDLPAGESTAAAKLVWANGGPKQITHSDGRFWPFEPLSD